MVGTGLLDSEVVVDLNLDKEKAPGVDRRAFRIFMERCLL